MKATLQTSTYYNDRRVASSSSRKTPQTLNQQVIQPAQVLASIKIAKTNSKLSSEKNRNNSNQAQRSSLSPETKQPFLLQQLKSIQKQKAICQEASLRALQNNNIYEESNILKNLKIQSQIYKQQNDFNYLVPRENQKREMEKKEQDNNYRKQAGSAEEFYHAKQRTISPKEIPIDQIDRSQVTLNDSCTQRYNKGDISFKNVVANKFLSQNYQNISNNQPQYSIYPRGDTQNMTNSNTFIPKTINGKIKDLRRRVIQGSFTDQYLPKSLIENQESPEQHPVQSKEVLANINFLNNCVGNLSQSQEQGGDTCITKEIRAGEIQKQDFVTKDYFGNQFLSKNNTQLNPSASQSNFINQIGSQNSSRQQTTGSVSTRLQTQRSSDSARQQIFSSQDSFKPYNTDSSASIPIFQRSSSQENKFATIPINDSNKICFSGNTTAAFIETPGIDQLDFFKMRNSAASDQRQVKIEKEQIYKQYEVQENVADSKNQQNDLQKKPFVQLMSHLFSGNTAKQRLGIPENKEPQCTLNQNSKGHYPSQSYILSQQSSSSCQQDSSKFDNQNIPLSSTVKVLIDSLNDNNNMNNLSSSNINTNCLVFQSHQNNNQNSFSPNANQQEDCFNNKSSCNQSQLVRNFSQDNLSIRQTSSKDVIQSSRVISKDPINKTPLDYLPLYQHTQAIFPQSEQMKQQLQETEFSLLQSKSSIQKNSKYLPIQTNHHHQQQQKTFTPYSAHSNTLDMPANLNEQNSNPCFLKTIQGMAISKQYSNCSQPTKCSINNFIDENTLPIKKYSSEFSDDGRIYSKDKIISSSSSNISCNQNTILQGSNIQEGMQDLFIKMKKKLIDFQRGEKQWQDEKSNLIYSLSQMQNQMDYLKLENMIIKSKNKD